MNDLASHEQLRRLLEHIPDGIAIHRQGTVLWVNRAMARFAGFAEPADAIGHSMLEIVPEAERAAWIARMQAPPDPLGARPSELRVSHPGGPSFVLEVVSSQDVEFDGGPARLVVCRDISERKRLDEQLLLVDRLASLGTLAAGVAHEINNPLAFAHAHLEQVARLVDGVPAAAEPLAAVREGLERVRAIVGDLKTFSRGDEEGLGPVDVAEVLQATLRLAAKDIVARAQLATELEPTAPAHANRARLGQVLLNLLLNAVECFPAESPPARNHVVARVRPGEEGRVVFEIADDGPGIPETVRRKIFDPFFTTKPIGQGTGLGLSITHRIVVGLGGTIDVLPNPGGGTLFRVSLPAAQSSEVRRARAAAAAVTAPATRRARLLVVDDEPRLLDALRALLADDHDVETATSGAEALARLAPDPTRYEVILCDLMMAGLTGMDVFERVRGLHPGLERRIVFMTGGAFSPRARAFLENVPNRSIEKPFDPALLFATIDEQIVATCT